MLGCDKRRYHSAAVRRVPQRVPIKPPLEGAEEGYLHPRMLLQLEVFGGIFLTHIGEREFFRLGLTTAVLPQWRPAAPFRRLGNHIRIRWRWGQRSLGHQIPSRLFPCHVRVIRRRHHILYKMSSRSRTFPRLCNFCSWLSRIRYWFCRGFSCIWFNSFNNGIHCWAYFWRPF